MIIDSQKIENIIMEVQRLKSLHKDAGTFIFFIGEKNSIDLSVLHTKLNSLSISFMGGIFPAVIAQNKHSETGIVIDYIKGSNRPVLVDIQEESISIPSLFIPKKGGCLLTLVDGLSANIAYFLDELYNIYSNKINYLGGGTGSLSLQQQPCLFTNEGIYQDKAILLLIEQESNLGVKHGWKELEGPFVATKTTKNTIEQLNWETAYDTYKKSVEKDSKTPFTKENFFEIAKGYPFGINKEYAEFIVRDPLMNNNGNLVCVGEVPMNSVLTILKGEKNSLIKAAKQATTQAIEQGYNQINHCFVFDCISRVLFLEEDFKEELEIVQDTLKENDIKSPLLGALTLGEISSFGDGKLDLSIGSSLELKKASEHFIKVLLSRKNLQHASIWINKTPVDNQAIDQYTIEYEYPTKIHKKTLAIKPNDTLIEALKVKKIIQVPFNDPIITSTHNNNTGSYIIFTLGEIGFLSLYSPASIEFSKKVLHQLEQVVQKFAISLKACLVYALSQKQIERIQMMAKFPDQNPNPVIRISKAGHILYFNKASLGILKVLEINENTLFQSSLKSIIKEVLSNDELLELEIKTNEIFYSLTFCPVKEYEYVNIYGKDISNIKQALNTIDKQKVFYENILNSLPSDIVAFDKNHKYSYINPVAVTEPKLRDWLIGKDDFDYVKKRKKDLSIAEDRREKFNTALLSGKQYEWAEQVINKNKEIEYHIRRMHPVFNKKGEFDMMIGYGIDVTKLKKIELALKEQEKKFRTVFNQSNDGIILQDERGNIIDANDRICTLLETKKEDLIGKNVTHIVPKSNFNKAISALKKVAQDGYYSFDIFLRKENGHHLSVEISASKIILNKQILFHGTVRDITERNKRNQELIAAKNMAERSMRAKELFLANMSHEIRTPMNAIIGMTGLLHDDPLTEKQQKHLQTIQQSGENLLVIINDILDFSKIESGKLEFESVGFKAKKLVKNLLATLNYKLTEKDVMLTSNIPETLYEQILVGDPTRLNQILLNLLSNATKFTHQGEINLTAQLVEEKNNNIRIQFKVTDTGIGISAEKVNDIFSSFSQADVGTTRKYGGTGLGLTITRRLVIAQGGKIWVESKEGKGSTFFVELEFQKGSTKDLPNKESTTNAISSEAFINKKVLLVEDNKINQFYATSILEKWKIQTTIADNGKLALDALEKDTFDLILMDMQMPVMDGIETTKYIRNVLKNNIPIIALTANKEIPLPTKKITTMYDLSILKQTAAGNSGFIKKMVALFIEETPKSIHLIEEGLSQQNWPQVKAAAHKIKPSFGILNLFELKEEIKTIEALAKKVPNEEEKKILIKLVKKLTERIPQIIEALKKEVE